jgi:hypothetical protein
MVRILILFLFLLFGFTGSSIAGPNNIASLAKVTASGYTSADFASETDLPPACIN